MNDSLVAEALLEQIEDLCAHFSHAAGAARRYGVGADVLRIRGVVRDRCVQSAQREEGVEEFTSLRPLVPTFEVEG